MIRTLCGRISLLVLLVLFIGVIASCARDDSNAVPFFRSGSGEVIVYSITRKAAKRFIENPRFSELNFTRDFNKVERFKITDVMYIDKVPQEEVEAIPRQELEQFGMIVDEYVYVETTYSTGEVEHAGLGESRLFIDSFHADMELVEFLGNKENIEWLLAQATIDCIIDEYFIIKYDFSSVYGMRPILFATSSQGEHIIKIYWQPDDRSIPAVDLFFTVYSYEEYRAEMKDKDLDMAVPSNIDG